ncbi:MAG: glycosyltransferase [Nitrospira sp.]
MFESLAMAKPIILGVEGESAELLQVAKAGICIEPEQADELAARVLELSQNPERCQQLGRNGRRYVMEHFDRIVLARKLASVLGAVEKSGVRPPVRGGWPKRSRQRSSRNASTVGTPRRVLLSWYPGGGVPPVRQGP